MILHIFVCQKIISHTRHRSIPVRTKGAKYNHTCMYMCVAVCVSFRQLYKVDIAGRWWQLHSPTVVVLQLAFR